MSLLFLSSLLFSLSPLIDPPSPLRSLSFLRGSNLVALGYDDGTVVIKVGSENPAISMDHAGKIIWGNLTLL